MEKDPTKFCTYEEFEKGVATLKEFCLLRAESISGQLDGTIGATSDTQESDTLIDAGALQINDMGSMGNDTIPQTPNGDMQGGQMPGGFSDGQMPDGEPGGTPPDFTNGESGQLGIAESCAPVP